jgi:predicted  nucleic acid-binding Zn-ribbon protein
MNTHMTDEQRIAELEDQLKEAERRIAELRQERDDARDLVQRQPSMCMIVGTRPSAGLRRSTCL